eukprot:XP_001702350.1 predicted protein [Chlamydomonas reinhardtii]
MWLSYTTLYACTGSSAASTGSRTPQPSAVKVPHVQWLAPPPNFGPYISPSLPADIMDRPHMSNTTPPTQPTAGTRNNHDGQRSA